MNRWVWRGRLSCWGMWWKGMTGLWMRMGLWLRRKVLIVIWLGLGRFWRKISLKWGIPLRMQIIEKVKLFNPHQMLAAIIMSEWKLFRKRAKWCSLKCRQALSISPKHKIAPTPRPKSFLSKTQPSHKPNTTYLASKSAKSDKNKKT